MQKTKVLVWADTPVAATGFSQVTRQILKRLNATGKYEFTVVGINHIDSWYDQNEFPYKILGSQRDMYSTEILVKLLQDPEYQIFFSINDIGIQDHVARLVSERKKVDQNFKWIAYFPQDLDFAFPEAFKWIDICDYPVTYTQFGKGVIKEYAPQYSERVRVIYHGSDLDEIYPITTDRDALREKYLKVKKGETLVINVNRNQWRKNWHGTFLAFREFKKKVKNSRLYVHAKRKDMGGDLVKQAFSAGLNIEKDIIWTPENISTFKGVGRDILNCLYNSADLYISTTFGEGWGLTITEAMQAKVPVVVPRNSSLVEILGENEERGYLAGLLKKNDINSYRYFSGESDFIRRAPDLNDFVVKMVQAVEDKEGTAQKVENAYQWIINNTWDKVTTKWIRLFEKASKWK